ncbi:MAG: GTP-binding protein [Brevinematales bacterium]|nr:GTP-binding protein [Brevinematales bacterium]
MLEVLKFFTCGNVDDGKSTLIGRLLYDSKAISVDIIEALSKRGNKPPNATIDLALITDGLKAEREQGITIDVAYKYFSTSKRKFMLVDTPGHLQYTRNMITGASGCDLGIILVDVRNGMTEQTKRHMIISSILEIPHLLICVNKMDLVGYDKDVFDKVSSEIVEFFRKIDKHEITLIPISAYLGDNVVKRSTNMPWYKGPTVLELLENIEIEYENFEKSRFQVQYIIRPNNIQDYRGYAGRVISGVYRIGDKVKILPNNYITKIIRIESNLKDVNEVISPYNCIIHLKDDYDIPRGTYIVKEGEEPIVSNEFVSYIFWMDERKKLVEGDKLIIMMGTLVSKCVIKEIIYKVDINTLNEIPSKEISSNEIAKVIIKTADPVPYDYYSDHRWTGCFILIDEITNNTVAGGTING